jgi:AAA family ATP:ADP antiporter
MKTSFYKITGIREGEALRAVLMFAYILLIITSLQILKPVRNSLFLTRFGVSQLPYVYLLVGVVVGTTIFFYQRIARRIRLGKLVTYSLVFSVSMLLLFRILLTSQYRPGWLAYAFYIWVETYGVILTAQFWLLTNFVFDAREARRIFGFIGAGAILGGIAGGYLTKWIVPFTGTVNLILICCVLLGCCLSILRIVWIKNVRPLYRERRYIPTQSDQRGTKTPLKLVFSSSHLRLIAGIVGIGVLVGNLVDYQFNVIAVSRIQDRDQLTAFFGFWLSNLSIISLVIQLFITPRILMKFGVGASLFFLPSGILLGTLYFLIQPGLWSGVLIKIGDGGLKHSVNKVGLELLYLPVPSHIKTQVKTFIDVFVDSFAEGLSGVVLIVAGLIIGTHIRSISMIVIALVLVWFGLVLLARKEYVNAFRNAIEKRTIDLEDQQVNLEDASLFEFIARILESDRERRILFVLNLIENSHNYKLVPYLRNLLKHPSDEIKVQVLEMLANFGSADFSSEVEPLVSDNTFEVRVGAINYLSGKAPDRFAKLESFLQDPSSEIRAAALMVAAHDFTTHRDFRKRFPFAQRFNALLNELRQEEITPELKIHGAQIIGVAHEPELYKYLHQLLKDSSREVLREAIRAAGETRSSEFIPELIQHLSTRRVRKQARTALAKYGDVIIPELLKRLKDPNESRNTRLSIPKVLALIGLQRSVDVLLAELHEPDLLLRYELIKALSKLKANFPNLKINREVITKEILEETRYYFRTLGVLQLEEGSQTENDDGNLSKARKLLIRALEERLDKNLERIFRLLGLRYSTQDMFSAYKGIVSNQNDLRANALEFLDNVLDRYLRRYILPIVEEMHSGEALDELRREFGVKEIDQKQTLKELLEGNDNWLRICALYVISALNEKECAPLVENLKQDADPIVRETAQYALRQLQAEA